MGFPKRLVQGSNQEMVLTGGPNAIRKAQEDIKMIMSVWREEYDAYRERQRRRRERERRLNAESRLLPKVGGVKEKETKCSTNIFSCLLVEEMSEKNSTKETKKESVVKMPSVVKPKAPSLTGWAAIAAKPAVVLGSVSSVVAPPMTMVKATTMSKLTEEEMMTIDEDDEDKSSGWFDWGDV
jgi:hypothetical protein